MGHRRKTDVTMGADVPASPSGLMSRCAVVALLVLAACALPPRRWQKEDIRPVTGQLTDRTPQLLACRGLSSRHAAQARGIRRACGSHPKGDYGGKGSWLRPDPRVPACRVSRQHQHAEPLLPASPAGDLLTGFSVHKPVDDLCRKATDLSAYAEMLGIPAAGPAHNRAFNCKNTIHTLCTGRKLRLSTGHAAIAHKWAERLP
jgi:hypothetical protein